MLKKTIEFETFDDPPKTVTRAFYFNYSKLEIAQLLEYDNLQERVAKLGETESGREAFDLFEKLILDAYGERNEHGGFDKSPELRKKFRSLNAFEALIFELIQDASLGAKFIEGCLPSKDVAEVKARLVAEGKLKEGETIDKATGPVDDPQLTAMVNKAAELQANPETTIEPGTPPEGVGQEEMDEAAMIAALQESEEKTWQDYKPEELLTMPQDQFINLVGNDPTKYPRPLLVIAMQRKQLGKNK